MAIGAMPGLSKALGMKSPAASRPSSKSTWSEERKGSTWLLAVLFGLLTAVVMAAPWLWPGSFTALYVCAAVFPFVALVATRAVLRLVRAPWTYSVDEKGITARPAGGAPVQIQWKDIEDVHVEPTRGRLLVCERSVEARIPIDFRMDDFAGLATEIGRRVFAPDGSPSLSSESKEAVGKGLQRGAGRWLLVITAPIWPILSIQWLGGALLVAWIATAAQLISWVTGWKSIVAANGALTLRYLFRSRAVPIDVSSPATLTLRDELGRHGSDLRVEITLRNGKTIQLAGLGRRAFLLFGELERLRSRSATAPAPTTAATFATAATPAAARAAPAIPAPAKTPSAPAPSPAPATAARTAARTPATAPAPGALARQIASLFERST